MTFAPAIRSHSREAEIQREENSHNPLLRRLGISWMEEDAIGADISRDSGAPHRGRARSATAPKAIAPKLQIAPMPDEPSITELLANARPGPGLSAAALLPVVYQELRALAGSYLSRNRSHTLQPTALVHEAYVKLISSDRAWSGRDHFMAVAARAMRQVLVDYARARNTAKRGGGAHRSDLSIEVVGHDTGAASSELDVIEVHRLLDDLAQLAPRPAHVAEMRLFGGMNTTQIAAVLGVSDFTVKQDWQFGRAWLAGKMQEESLRGR